MSTRTAAYFTAAALAAAASLLYYYGEARANTVNPPGTTDLTPKVLTTGDKPWRDDATRPTGFEVLYPFTYVGHDAKESVAYKIGDQIIDHELMRRVEAQLKNTAGVASGTDQTSRVGQLDPECLQCEPITVGKMLSLLELKSEQLCKIAPDSPACTPDEKKAEADLRAMASREDDARLFRTRASLVIDRNTRENIKAWAGVLLPVEVAIQVVRAVDPTWASDPSTLAAANAPPAAEPEKKPAAEPAAKKE